VRVQRSLNVALVPYTTGYHRYVKSPAELRRGGICHPTVTRTRILLASSIAPNERTPEQNSVLVCHTEPASEQEETI